MTTKKRCYVYILKSILNNDIYVGSTSNVEKGLELHNQGRVRSTKANRPWVLLEKQDHQTRSAAVRNERFLKAGQQKERLLRKYGQVAKW